MLILPQIGTMPKTYNRYLSANPYHLREHCTNDTTISPKSTFSGLQIDCTSGIIVTLFEIFFLDERLTHYKKGQEVGDGPYLTTDVGMDEILNLHHIVT